MRLAFRLLLAAGGGNRRDRRQLDNRRSPHDVGFGDAIRITVKKGQNVWRMQVDCGAHPHCTGRGIPETVKTIIDDLARECPDGEPYLDVLVATHRHRDHISGFALEDWSRVRVNEVWLPFVEDETDPRTTEFRNQQGRAAKRILGLIEQRQRVCALDSEEAETLRTAHAFAVNSGVNAKAMGRLMKFVESGPKFFPRLDAGQNAVPFDKVGVIAHILGPPSTADMIKKMNPPASARWLKLHLDEEELPKKERSDALFAADYIVPESEIPQRDVNEINKLKLDCLNDEGLLAAASFLERSINNTSLFFLLEIDNSFRMLFPGDSQSGGWRHVLETHRELLEQVDFYKIGHHASHNATPKEFATTWTKAGDAMLPWGSVDRWKDSIPHPKLVKALGKNHAIVGHSEKRLGKDPRGTLMRTDAWTQLTFTLEN